MEVQRARRGGRRGLAARGEEWTAGGKRERAGAVVEMGRCAEALAEGAGWDAMREPKALEGARRRGRHWHPLQGALAAGTPTSD